MGRGDKKTAKGKRTIGSFGVSRKKKKSTYPSATVENKETVKAEVEKKAEKKTAAKKPAAAKKVKAETSTEE